jgi:hypothetical protein
MTAPTSIGFYRGNTVARPQATADKISSKHTSGDAGVSRCRSRVPPSIYRMFALRPLTLHWL